MQKTTECSITDGYVPAARNTSYNLVGTLQAVEQKHAHRLKTRHFLTCATLTEP